jgi:hypothetical protein
MDAILPVRPDAVNRQSQRQRSELRIDIHPTDEEHPMMKIQRTLALAATTLALLGAGTAARAETMDDNSFSGMFKMAMMDSNKDGMVSKAEFLAMMGKVWDMKAKEMAVKGDKMSNDELQKMVVWLSRGGNKN